MSPKAICLNFDCQKEFIAETFSDLEELELQHHKGSKSERDNIHDCRGFAIYSQDERTDGILRDGYLGVDVMSHGIFWEKAPRPKS